MATDPKKPEAMMVCIMGHYNDLGAFREGTRLRASHPDVAKFPQGWVPEGLDDGERYKIHAERFPLRGA